MSWEQGMCWLLAFHLEVALSPEGVAVGGDPLVPRNNLPLGVGQRGGCSNGITQLSETLLAKICFSRLSTGLLRTTYELLLGEKNPTE